jgi:hypothetical protein
MSIFASCLRKINDLTTNAREFSDCFIPKFVSYYTVHTVEKLRSVEGDVSILFFFIFLTVHLRIDLVGNQLDAQFLL